MKRVKNCCTPDGQITRYVDCIGCDKYPQIKPNTMKTLIHKKDFKIIQSKEIVEYFVWKCPNCKKDCKTIEYGVNDKTLFCSGCLKFIPYSWE